jgi:hypothetical protein
MNMVEDSGSGVHVVSPIVTFDVLVVIVKLDMAAGISHARLIVKFQVVAAKSLALIAKFNVAFINGDIPVPAFESV